MQLNDQEKPTEFLFLFKIALCSLSFEFIWIFDLDINNNYLLNIYQIPFLYIFK